MNTEALFGTRFGKLAWDIYQWCVKNDLWDDNTIYFDGHAITNCIQWGSSEKANALLCPDPRAKLYYFKDKNPRDYFEYVNPEGLSMSFEGSLNHVLNAYTPGWAKLEEEFRKIFARHGCYYEMGHSWNLTTYDL